MKKLLYILPLFAAVTLSSCGDDDEGTPSGASNGGMSAKVNGTAWTSPATTTYYDTFGGGISVDGTKMNGQTSGETISLSIPTATAPGTFTGQQVTATFMTFTTAGDMQMWTSDSTTTVTISKLQDNKISGTFSFTANGASGTAGTKTVTDGVFTDVKLEE